MDNAIYAALTRQTGLQRELRTVANNVANANTTGFRREGVIFAEHLSATGARGLAGTLSMGLARGRVADLGQGALEATGGRFDLGIEGEGFFMVDTPEGLRLTRAGAFMPDAAGRLVTADGMPVLDDGRAPIDLPPGATAISIGADGTITADGAPVAQVGVVTVADPAALLHRGGTLFEATDAAIPTDGARLRQGFLEASNVDPVFEVSRLVEVQRSYELGQALLDREDERIRGAITSLTR